MSIPKTLKEFVDENHTLKAQIKSFKSQNKDTTDLELKLKRNHRELLYVHEITKDFYQEIRWNYWRNTKPVWIPSKMIKRIKETETNPNSKYYLFEFKNDLEADEFKIKAVEKHIFDNQKSCFPISLINHLIFERNVKKLEFVKCNKVISKEIDLSPNNTTLIEEAYNVISIKAIGLSEGKRYFDIVEDPDTNLYLRQERRSI